VLAAYGLAGASFLLLLMAAGFLIARRWDRALKLFASALLALSLSAAISVPLLVGQGKWIALNAAFALSLHLAGIGQFVAALRKPGSYPSALLYSAVAAAFVVGPIPAFGIRTVLRGVLIAVPSLLIAAASIMTAFRDKPLPRLVAFLLVNLTLFLLAFAFAQTDDYILIVDDPERFVVKEQIDDLVRNTRWAWLFAASACSTLVSTAFVLTRRRYMVIALAVLVADSDRFGAIVGIGSCSWVGPTSASRSTVALRRAPGRSTASGKPCKIKYLRTALRTCTRSSGGSSAGIGGSGDPSGNVLATGLRLLII
jgi:hypothetical protein